MTSLTSMADFYFKVKTDKRYEALLLYTKDHSRTGRNVQHDFENAIKWIEKWITDNPKVMDSSPCPCCIVIEVMNRNMDLMEKKNLI